MGSPFFHPGVAGPRHPSENMLRKRRLEALSKAEGGGRWIFGPVDWMAICAYRQGSACLRPLGARRSAMMHRPMGEACRPWRPGACITYAFEGIAYLCFGAAMKFTL